MKSLTHRLIVFLAFIAPLYGQFIPGGKKIGDLPAAPSVPGTALFEISNSGTSQRATASQIAAYIASVGGGGAWGTITGTLSAQADLQAALDAKLGLAAAAGLYQPLDADLTSIAALTTSAYGRSLLATADAAALRTLAGLGTLATQNGTISDYLTTASAAANYQPLDADLTALAGLAHGDGVLKNDGAGALSWLETSTGGNGAADGGKLVTYDANGGLALTAGILSGLSIQFDGDPARGWILKDSFMRYRTGLTASATLYFPASPTGVRVYNLPDASGTVLLGSAANNGASLTDLNASNLASGTVPTARLGTGTANSTTYLRGDNTWQTITSGDTPGGSGTELQYRAGASTLGAVTGSSVSGGALTLTAPLTVDGTTNAAQLVVQGHTTQTAALQEWQNSAATVVAKVDNAGTHYALASGSGYQLKRGDADTGIYSPDTSSVGFAANGTAVFYVSSNYGAQINASSGYFGFSTTPHVGSTADVRLYRDAANVLQLGADHATTASNQRFKGHDVTTGTGAAMDIAGGKGSVAGGSVTLSTSTTNGEPTAKVEARANGSVAVGAQSALATDATNGFIYVPTCAGTPTGAPTAITGLAPIVVDTTNNKLYFYSGGAWRDAGP